MSYAQSIDGLNTELSTGKLAQSIDSLDMLLSTSEGTVQDGIVLISPANGEINVSVTPSFDWDSSTIYDAYKILIADNPEFTNAITAYITSSDYAQTEALLNATNYHWKVIGGDVTDRPAIVPVVGQEDSVNGDIIALQAFRDSLGGDSWTNTWPATITVDNYESIYGVNTDTNGRIIHLDMQRGTTEIPAFRSDPSGTVGNNLSGQLPSEIGNWTKLKYFNVKQNSLVSTIPSEIERWADVQRILLSGPTQEPSPGDPNHPGKSNVSTNRFYGEIPTGVKQLNNLVCFESQKNGYVDNGDRVFDGLSGQIPHEWGVNLEFLSLGYNSFSGTLPLLSNSNKLQNIHVARQSVGIEGTIPKEWQNHTPLKHIRIQGNKVTGDIPVELGSLNQIEFFMVNDNLLTGPFPSFLFGGGKNPLFNTFHINSNNLSGTLPNDSSFSEDMEGRFRDGVFNISYNNFEGSLPNWVSRITPQQYAIQQCGFTGDLPVGFHDMKAPIYRNLRYVRAFGNQFTGSLPKVNFVNPNFDGAVTSNSGTSVVTDLNVDVIYAGTVTNSSSDWIQDSNANWDEPWTDHEVTVIVPGGTNIVFISNESTNYTAGTLYSRNQADLSGTEGYAYEIRRAVSNKHVMFFQDGVASYVRTVQSASNNTLTLDSSISNDISGFDFVIYEESTNILYVHYGTNQFDGNIPVQWAGIRTTRSNFYVAVDGNNLSGRVEPEISSISTIDLSSFNVSNNKFTVDDLSDILVRGFTELIYTPQNKVGTPKNILFTQNGQEITIEYYNLFGDASNIYEWFKNNQSIGSGLGPEITITVNESDSGSIIYLEVTNSDVPNLVSVTEDAILELEDTNV